MVAVTVSEKDARAFVPHGSLAVTVKVEFPATVGVPLMAYAPCAVSVNASPAGSDPAVMAKDVWAKGLGGHPPVVAMICWYGVPTTPGATDAVEIENAPPLPPPFTEREKVWEAEALALSDTVALKLKTPADVAAPLSTPEEEFNEIPGGSDPVEAQVYGGDPPLAAKVIE